MKNRRKNAWKALQGNRGSGVVLVLVAISCITLMTTSLLHLSYTAFKMKAAERQNKVELYQADAKVDELVAELQNEVSAVITKAKKEVLINYSTNDKNGLFKKELVNTLAEKLGSNSGRYNTTYLENLLNNTVTIASDSQSKYIKENARFILQNVRLTYVSDSSGNSTTISTDIIIDVTNLTYNGNWDIESTVRTENWSTE